jgi:hypothetical protein
MNNLVIKRSRLLGLLIIFVLFFSLGFFKSASALTISPARIDINGNPGQTLSGEIEIINEESASRTYYTSYENFEPRGDTGAPYFIGSKDGLATWINSIPSIQIEKGAKKILSYTIKIPQNAEAGGYFGALFFGSTPPGGSLGGEVSIGGRIGALILLRVNGDIKEGGGLLDFTINNKQKIFTTLPITFGYRMNNTGGDRVVPIGNIDIKNTFRISTAKLIANKNEGSVLPNSSRKFNVVWGDDSQILTNKSSIDDSGFLEMASKQWNNFYFGWYTANINLVWGTTNQTANSSYDFFVIPWQLLTLILVTLLILFFFGRFILRKYNKMIISSALKRN